MAEPENISIAICTYNRKEMLHQALDSLVKQKNDKKFNYEIVIVDDGSTDGTKKMVEKFKRSAPIPLRYIYQPGKGVAAARNLSVKEAKGDWVAFFDDDQIADRNWLKELYSTATKRGADCVGGPRFLSISDEKLQKIHPVCRALLGEIVVKKEERKNNRKWYPDTGNILIKREVFYKVGMFDESLISGGEDLDFFRRVRRRSLKVWVTQKAIVHHMIPQYRLEKDFLIMRAFRSGGNAALIDFREFGNFKMILIAVARIAHTIIIIQPGLINAKLKKDNKEKFGRKCQIFKMKGYVRRSFSILFPKIFKLENAYDCLEMRKETEIFGSHIR